MTTDTTTPATLSAEELDAIEARANAATEGPWIHAEEVIAAGNPIPDWGLVYAVVEDGGETAPRRVVDTFAPWLTTEREKADCRIRARAEGLAWCEPAQIAANAEFVSKARTDIPALIASHRALAARLTEWEIAADEGTGDAMIGVAITPDWLRAQRREQEASRRAQVEALTKEQDRLRSNVRELAAACHQRAEERNEARYQHSNAVVEDLESREAMATALNMSWDGCDPFEWPEIIARANEMRTTIRMRPAWQARATQAEAERDAARAEAQAMREALEPLRPWADQFHSGCAGDMARHEVMREVERLLRPGFAALSSPKGGEGVSPELDKAIAWLREARFVHEWEDGSISVYDRLKDGDDDTRRRGQEPVNCFWVGGRDIVRALEIYKARAAGLLQTEGGQAAAQGDGA